MQAQTWFFIVFGVVCLLTFIATQIPQVRQWGTTKKGIIRSLNNEDMNEAGKKMRA